MYPDIDHWWNGWDAVSVLWIAAGILALALIPRVGSEAGTVVMLLCAAGVFILSGFGRRLRKQSHRHEHHRPFDAPD